MATNRTPARGPARPGADPRAGTQVTITVDGARLTGQDGQSIAGVLLANGIVAWRRGPRSGGPRGVFCGIGVCHDCLVAVNGLPDVRACQRRARDGDIVEGGPHGTSEGGGRAEDA